MVYAAICALSVFAIIGLYYVCRGLYQCLFRRNDEHEIILIEPIGKNREDAEFLLRNAAHKVMWMGRFAPDRVICLDCDMDSETRRLCRIVCSDYPFMELYSKEEMLEKIGSM